MNQNIEQLIEISRYYGKDKRYVIAGGGNTSFKNEDRLWVKASGFSLGSITEEGFAVLDRSKLAIVSEKVYSTDPVVREEEIKNDLAAACLTKDRRPSVETSLHNALQARFVVHLHPTVVNGLMCSQKAASETARLFGDTAIYIPYIDPGYTLFKEVENRIQAYYAQFGKEPSILFLQNHGIFVGADTTDEIKKIYESVVHTIKQTFAPVYPHMQTDNLECEHPVKQTFDPVYPPLEGAGGGHICNSIHEIIPAIRMMLSKDGLKTLRIRNNSLITRFAASEENFTGISQPFTPDIIVYCKSEYIYIACDHTADLLAKAEQAINAYYNKWGFMPKALLIQHIGLVVAGDHAAGCDTILDVFEDMIQIAFIAQSFGGEHPMTNEQIKFIDNWEVENYRRKISAGQSSGRVENKTIIITGAAQGFGEGIAKCLTKEGANIVVADLNEEAGKATVETLCEMAKSNRAIFVPTDVTDTESLQKMIHATIVTFGGFDVFISNAGILKAGSLEEMTPETFDLVTKVNYNAYFYCARAASQVMKLQNKYAPDNYGDIIQINSKSGLRGSKANFAYAGGKFGGIGLTQSFALELAPFRIKVNAICPGNFYEGPLWADPENGLFVQYLRAGKVPGATTIDDVQSFYMNQVPMRKGTGPEDVSKAILYLIEQTCETGQAVPVTGGQIMMN